MRYIILATHEEGQDVTIECDTLAELESEYNVVRSWGNDWQIDVTCEVTRRYTLIDVTSPSETLVEDLRKMVPRA